MADRQVEWNPIAQMTVKKIGCDPKDAIRQEKSVYLCRIYGEATSIKTKESKSGDPYQYLVGEFRAVTAEGKKFESVKLFLPGGILEQIESALVASEGKPVQFGYDLFSAPDDNSVGYRYAAKTIMKTEASDRLTAMAKLVDQKPIPSEETKAPAKKEKA